MAMTNDFLRRTITASSVAVILAALTAAGHPRAIAQVSQDEREAASRVTSVADANGALEAAAAFVKKYPKSTLTADIGGHIAFKISETKDASQKILLSEHYVTIFKGTGGAEIIEPVRIDAYVSAGKFSDAFRLGASWLENHPDDVLVLTQLAVVGTDQIRLKNTTFQTQSQNYATKAVEIVEAGTKPARMSDERWNEYRTKWLPQLYQSLGLLALYAKNPAEALLKLQKSASLNSSDPTTFFLIGTIYNEAYQDLAIEYQSMKQSAAKDETLKKALAQLELVCDAYAHAVALSEGKSHYQQLHDELLHDLESYYKYLHRSTDGLQNYIDRYKKP